MRAIYFSDKELACRCGCGLMPQNELIVKLDTLRTLYGGPLVTTSVARCEAYNKKIGGAPQSPHPLGLAVDIACNDSLERYRLVERFFIAGFKRMEWGTPTWLHFDLAEGHRIFLP